jgi:hypothetical protein
MIGYLDETVQTALVSDRFPFVRAVGEMSWVLEAPPGAAGASVHVRLAAIQRRDAVRGCQKPPEDTVKQLPHRELMVHADPTS